VFVPLLPCKEGTKAYNSTSLTKFTRKSVVLLATAKEKRGKYQILLETEKSVIGKYASEHGAVWKFKNKKPKTVQREIGTIITTTKLLLFAFVI